MCSPKLSWGPKGTGDGRGQLPEVLRDHSQFGCCFRHLAQPMQVSSEKAIELMGSPPRASRRPDAPWWRGEITKHADAGKPEGQSAVSKRSRQPFRRWLLLNAVRQPFRFPEWPRPSSPVLVLGSIW